MKYLVFRIPTAFNIKNTYKLTESISLVPASKFSLRFAGGGAMFCNSFFYVEQVSEGLKLIDVENLKEFIRFWAFVIGEHHGITHLEMTDDEQPHFASTIPSEIIQSSDGQPLEILNPEEIHIRIENQFSKEGFSLKNLYSFYLTATEDLKGFINLYLHNPNKGAVNACYSVFDNHLLKPILNWFIIDALVQEKKCETLVSCQHGCLNSEGVNKFALVHSVTPMPARFTELLKEFEDKEFYIGILQYFRGKRGSFVHTAGQGKKPEFRKIEPDPVTGIGYAQATENETLKNADNEGLAAMNARILLNNIVHTILLNKLVPELNMWPKFEMVKMKTFTMTNSGVVKP